MLDLLGILMLLIIGAGFGFWVYITDDWFDDIVWKVAFYIVSYFFIYEAVSLIIDWFKNN